MSTSLLSPQVTEHLLHLLAVADRCEPHPYTLSLLLEAAGLGRHTPVQVRAWLQAIPECSAALGADPMDSDALMEVA